MNINDEIKQTVNDTFITAIRRYFDVQGSSEYHTEKQYNEIISAFDTVYHILSLMDENIHFNYESSNELDQIINISKCLADYMGDPSKKYYDFTGYMINTLTQVQLTSTLTK